MQAGGGGRRAGGVGWTASRRVHARERVRARGAGQVVRAGPRVKQAGSGRWRGQRVGAEAGLGQAGVTEVRWVRPVSRLGWLV